VACDHQDVDDVIAVEVQLAGGGRRFFVTWGRIQDPVNPDPVCATVLRFAHGCDLGDAPASARVCRSLREAADTADAPYFYECFMALCRQPIPSGGDFESWRQIASGGDGPRARNRVLREPGDGDSASPT
jgi:hypothetical protein